MTSSAFKHESALDEEDLACAVTYDDVKRRLENVESQLALRLELPRRSIRQKLIAMDRAERLDHGDDLITEWHSAYSVYMEYTENWPEPPEPPAPREPKKEGVAEAAPSPFVLPAGRPF